MTMTVLEAGDAGAPSAPSALQPDVPAVITGPSELTAGQKVYLVDARWWRKRLAHIADPETKSPPGQVKNQTLINSMLPSQPSYSLNPLIKPQDYVIMDEPNWRATVATYGGGPELQRLVEDDGTGTLAVQLFPQIPYKVYSPNRETWDWFLAQRTWAVIDLKAVACKEFGCTEADHDLFDFYARDSIKLLDDCTLLSEAGLLPNQDLLLARKGTACPTDSDAENSHYSEPRASGRASPAADDTAASPPMGSLFDNTPPRTTAPIASTTRPFLRASRSTYNEDSYTTRDSAAPGLAGLSNLGNTCFMNSSLQCLTHAVPLMRCFLSGQWQADVNSANPLGMRGELAHSFARLICSLWQGRMGYVTPRGFKAKIGEFAPQFLGYQQHDSQEFLAFLLDGLHEDLNRIHNKPYIEEKDSAGRPDEELAKEAWDNYRARNDSFIVDHCQGLYKSTLDCPECGNHSVKFDPFMYLSLPLPESRVRTLHPVVVYADGSAPPLRMALDIPSTGTLRDLYKAIAATLSLPPVPAPAGGRTPPPPADAAADIDLDLEHGGSASAAAAPPAQDTPRVPAEEAMCASKFSINTFREVEVTLLDNPKASLADVMEASGNRDPTLVVYFYPDPALAPAPSRRPLVITHQRRFRTSYPRVQGFSAPLVLWCPQDGPHLYSLDDLITTPSPNAMHIISVPPSAPIYSLITPCLRPFLNPNYAPATDTDRAALAPTPTAPATTPTTTAPPDPSLATTAHLEPTPTDPSASSAPAPPPPPPPLPNTKPTPNDPTPPSAPDAMDISPTAPKPDPPSHSDAPTLPSGSEPFNMWAAQDHPPAAPPTATAADKPTAAAAATTTDPAEPPGPPPPPFTIMLTDNTRHRTSWYSSNPKLAPPSEQRNFVLDWGIADATGPYDTSLLEKPHDHPSVAAANARSREPARPVTLEACLEAFTQPERLTESDTWYCPRCKQHVQAAKKLDLWSCPELLVVHLKRFSYSRNRRDKLETLVDFPLTGLDLSKHMLQQGGPLPVYDLFAVSNHYGGLGGGHYTATALLPGTNKWYNFDDSHVTEVTPAALKTSAAYVLFYRRRSDATADPPTLLPDLLRQLSSQQQQDAATADGPAATRAAVGTTSPASLIGATVHPDDNAPATGYRHPTPTTPTESPTAGSPDMPGARTIVVDIPRPANYTFPPDNPLEDAMEADTTCAEDANPAGPPPSAPPGPNDAADDDQGDGGDGGPGSRARGEEAGRAPMVLGRTPPQMGPPPQGGELEASGDDGWDMVPRAVTRGVGSGGADEEDEEDDGAGSTAASAGRNSEYEMVGQQPDSDDSMLSTSQ